MSEHLTVGALHHDAAIERVLDADRLWCVYALCDLDPPQRRDARYLGSLDAAPTAVVLLYHTPDHTVLCPCGDERGVQDVLAGARADDLPAEAFLMARETDLPSVAARYSYGPDALWSMLRLVRRADRAAPDRQPQEDAAHQVERLTAADYAALQVLYTTEMPISPDEIDSGIYYGVRASHLPRRPADAPPRRQTPPVAGTPPGETVPMAPGTTRAGDASDPLVAVAGTHAYSVPRSLGIVGGVYTAPAYRGLGLATLTTGAVVRELQRLGIREMALNVREDNIPAIRAYTRLGFVARQRFWEGFARKRGG